MYLRFVVALSLATAFAAFAAWLLLARLTFMDAGLILSITVVGYIAAVAAAAFHFLWNPVLAPYPARRPASDAVRRRYQSFGLGIVNMGGSIHAAADDECLHLVPLRIWQALGARSASIPWSALTPIGRSGRVARLGACRLDGPAWCMSGRWH